MLACQSVRLLKRSALARTVAVVLLLWTAIDVTNADLCALDQQAAFPHQEQPTVASQPVNAPVAPIANQADDCFCCSHCVNTGVLPVLLRASASARLDMPEPAAATHVLYQPLDRPPQVLS
jgi:hypothetical protein